MTTSSKPGRRPAHRVPAAEPRGERVTGDEPAPVATATAAGDRPRDNSGDLRIEYLPLSLVVKWGKNPKRHAADHLGASMDRFGFTSPILINETTGVMVAGHGRCEELERKKAAGESPPARIRVEGGEWYVPVVRGVGFATDDEAAAYAVADNHIVELGGWDDALLVDVLDGVLANAEMGLVGIGYTDADLASIHQALKESQDAGAAANRKIERDEVPEVPTTPVSKNGDLWILGNASKNGHRIICADSRDKAALARLMDGKKAQLYSTDPPYGVDYTGTSHPLNARDKAAGKEAGSNSKDHSEIYWDTYESNAAYQQMLTDVFAAALEHLEKNSAWYCWHASSMIRENLGAWESVGVRYHETIIWVKPTFVLGHLVWHYKMEPALMGWVKGNRPHNNHVDEMTNVWEAAWADGKKRAPTELGHPTSKPTRLFELPMLKHTNIGDVCLESFSGSGTQIIAGEITGRRCFAIERMPVYVDCAITRWEAYTGHEAILEGDGRTFAQVKLERLGAASDSVDSIE